jgi:hypothetical protein
MLIYRVEYPLKGLVARREKLPSVAERVVELVIGAGCLSNVTDYTDRSTSIR